MNLCHLNYKETNFIMRYDKFSLLETDKNANKFYIYPKDENQFKNEAFGDRKIFVQVMHPVSLMHPSSKVENITRQATKIWSTSVYWNINSMPSSYANLIHLSEGRNLKVYACPMRYKHLFDA